MSQMRRSLTLAFTSALLSVIAGACDRSPASPTSVPTPVPALPESPPVRLTGRVIDSASRGVAGARIALQSNFNEGIAADARADQTGAYALTIPGPEVLMGASLAVNKEGFEQALHFVWLGEDPPAEVTRDLLLHSIVRIKAGESLAVSVKPEDPLCEDGAEAWLCRRVRIVAPMAGLLRAEVSAGTTQRPSRFVITLPGGPMIGAGYPNSLQMPIEAGQEALVDVVLVGASSGRTTLRTRIE